MSIPRHCSVLWGIITHHLECESVLYPLASCELVARPGGGVRKPLPVASLSKPLLHRETEGDSGLLKSLLLFALSYRTRILGQHLCCLRTAHRSPDHHQPARALFSPAQITSCTIQLFHLGDAPPERELPEGRVTPGRRCPCPVALRPGRSLTPAVMLVLSSSQLHPHV